MKAAKLEGTAPPTSSLKLANATGPSGSSTVARKAAAVTAPTSARSLGGLIEGNIAGVAMAQPVTKLRIFLGSPGDTTPERDAVGKIIEELNITTADPKHLVLELVRWETHVWPGFDRTAQEVINKRIGAYDIFIGIMWNRLGTPTGDAASGTVEEFDRAYRRWLTHKQPKLFYYFNNKPFNPTSADDLRQKGDVLAFKDSLRTIDGLYYDYNGIDEFKDFARRHIALEVGQFTPRAPMTFCARRCQS